MRLLHVNDHDPASGFGGAEVYVGRLIAAQRERGHEVDVLFADSGTNRSRLLDLWDRQAQRRLADRVAAFRPDVVHIHGFVRELSPAVLVPTGVPTVLTFHDLRVLGSSEHHFPDPRALAGRLWVTPVSLRLARRLSVVTAVGQVMNSALIAARLPTAGVIPAPVPKPLVPPTDVRECHDVVYVGRLSPDKGVNVLLEAFALLTPNHPTVRLRIVGDGPSREQLQRQAGAQVVFEGRQPAEAVSRVLGQARVVGVPSLPALRREGAPLVVIEALRHARPVVGSDDPGIAELMALLGGDVVPAGDAGALAARLDHWLRHGEQASVRGQEAAVRTASRHEPAVVAARSEELYRFAVGGGAGWR